MLIENDSTIASVSLVNGKLEVIRRYKSNAMYTCHPARPVPDQIVKEIYAACEDGNIILESTEEGKHTPSHTVPERIEF